MVHITLLTYPMSSRITRKAKLSVLAFCFTVVLITDTQAQKKQIQNLHNYDMQWVHFGFLLGINSFTFIPKPIDDLRKVDSLYSIAPQSALGFSLGIVSNLHLGDNFDFRFLPTLSFGERSLVYTIRFPSQDTTLERSKLVESTLIEFPLMMKFKSARHTNFRTYLLGGVKPTIDLASQDKVDSKGEKILKIKRNDVHAEIGVGFDFYSQYFKFSPELKLAFGLRNLLVQENNIYTVGMNALQSRALYISFTFE